MDSVTTTLSLEELAKNRQLSEEELAVLSEENSPDSLFRRFGRDGIVNIIKGMRSKYQSEADKEYIRELIYRIVGEGSDLNWGAKRNISQGLVTCASAPNKVEVINSFNVLASGATKSSHNIELKLHCPLKNEYLVLKDFVKYCCSYPEQPIKPLIKTIEEFGYRKPRNFLANNT